MILGIVGPEAAKWTVAGETSARNIIRAYLTTGKYAGVTSGACHLGGVDIWAREETTRRGIFFKEYPPKDHGWHWYKQRNQAIARLADEVICITPVLLLDGSRGWCKHCREHHVSSGGCWTVRYADRIGKKHDVIEVIV